MGHEDAKGEHVPLGPGSLIVLSAHEEVRHALSMEKGRTARWLSIVVRLPWHTEPPATSLQVLTPERPAAGADGTVRTPLIGASGPARTSSGLELVDIEFAKRGNAFVRVGGGRRGVAYVLGGTGSIEGEGMEPGQGALLENMTGASLEGSAGFRVALASVPRPSEPGA